MARAQGELFAVSEALLDHDENVARWRSLHVLMVEREIGAKRGTGGSSGVAYLRSTLDKRFFTHLRQLRRAVFCESFTLDNQVQERSPIPFHPGALKYFKEKGIGK